MTGSRPPVTASLATPLMTDAVDTVELPTGSGYTLWNSVAVRGASVVGRATFQGTRICVRVLDRTDVLFSTDVGMTLVRAIEEGEIAFRSARVLDIGCGAGIHTITALVAGASHVTAIDVHPPAVAATAWNVLANELPLDRVKLQAVPLSDFEGQARFDIVMCNPPHFPSDTSYDKGRGVDVAALGGRPDGRCTTSYCPPRTVCS
ncbi:MAG: 50S ribosomal protein L11 methyltransferase [Egibacteraceae bacterium]